MTRPISAGIIGFGRSGHGIHADAISLLPSQYTVAAIHDPLPDRHSDPRWPDAKACSTVEELLASPEVELVIVASPNRFHAGHARQALQAGKHVLCEKPFGFTTADVDSMIAAASASQVVLQPFQQRRYEPDFRKVREVCESGLLGKITLIRISLPAFTRRWDWQTSREPGGGQLYNNGPHPIDHALEFFGPGEPDVWCEMHRSLASGDAEDEFHILLRGQGAPTIQIDLLATAAFPQDRWYVCGTAGGLRGNPDHLEWKWVDWSTMPERPLDLKPTADRGYNREELTWNQDIWTASGVADGGAGAPPAKQPVLDLYRDLWGTIREGAPQVITPSAIRRRVAILQRCYELTGIPFPQGTLIS